MEGYIKLVEKEFSKRVREVNKYKVVNLEDYAQKMKAFGEELSNFDKNLMSISKKYVSDNQLDDAGINDINEYNKTFQDRFIIETGIGK